MATNSVRLRVHATKDIGAPDEAARRQWVGGNMRRYTPSPPVSPAPPELPVLPVPPPSAVGVPEDGWFPLPRVRPVPPSSPVAEQGGWFPFPRVGQAAPPVLPVPPPSAVGVPEDGWFPLPRVAQAVPSAAAMGEEDESVALPRAGRPTAPGAVEVPAGGWFPPPALMTQPLLAPRRRTRPWFKVGLVVAFLGVANSAMLIPSSAANEIAVPGNDLAAVAASLYVMGDNQRDNADGSQADSHPAAAD